MSNFFFFEHNNLKFLTLGYTDLYNLKEKVNYFLMSNLFYKSEQKCLNIPYFLQAEYIFANEYNNIQNFFIKIIDKFIFKNFDFDNLNLEINQQIILNWITSLFQFSKTLIRFNPTFKFFNVNLNKYYRFKFTHFFNYKFLINGKTNLFVKNLEFNYKHFDLLEILRLYNEETF